MSQLKASGNLRMGRVCDLEGLNLIYLVHAGTLTFSSVTSLPYPVHHLVILAVSTIQPSILNFLHNLTKWRIFLLTAVVP